MHKIDFLPDVLILLATAVFVVAIFRKLKLSPVLGYFCAGSLIGPSGFGFILELEKTRVFGEIGVIFLLFVIGLELTFDRLKSMRLHVFGFGSMQIIFTSLLIAGILKLIGINNNAIVVIAGGMSLSSTALVIQVLAENRMQSTQVGRLSFATLLMQDFAVVPLLVMLPIITGGGNNILQLVSMAFLKALLALGLIFLLGRLLLRPLFSMIGANSGSETSELFVATTILIALGAAWTTEYFGLSTALGAFVAGSLVAETEFQQQAEESINHFKSLFLGLFFMTVGMSINLQLIIDKFLFLFGVSLFTIIIKAFIIIILALWFKFNISSAIQAGLLLSQGGEFAFVLFTLAAKQNIFSEALEQNLLMIITITMAITPLLAKIGAMIADKIEHKSRHKTKTNITRELHDLNNHVIVGGFGRVGRMVAKMLEEEGISYVICDAREKIIEDAKEEGFPIYLGDVSEIEVLKMLHIDRAQSLIISFPGKNALIKSVKKIRQYINDIPIIARVDDFSNSTKLYEAGVDVLVPETYETGLQLGAALMSYIGIGEFEINRIKSRFRAGNYVHAIDEYEEEE